MPSFKHQFYRAIDASFEPGRSKHSDKKNPEESPGERIYSYKQRKNLKDLSSNFVNFCKENNVKGIKNLNPEVAKAFLEAKQREGASGQTIKVYRSELSKIGRVMSNFYGKNIDLKSPKLEPQSQAKDQAKLRTVAMSDKDLTRFLESKTRLSESKMGVILSRSFGLRVSEVVKLRPCDVSERGIQIIQSKGGRNRFVPARTEQQREVIRTLKEHFGADKLPTDRYFSTKENSMNRYLHTGLKRIGITTYSDHRTGFHSLRKAYATEYYNSLRASGKSHTEAWDTVSQDLGHGKGREDLFRVYVVK